MAMTPRERVRAILNRQPVDRFPVDLWYTPEVAADLSAHFGVPDGPELYRALGIDKIAWVNPESHGKGAEGGSIVPNLVADCTIWGTKMEAVNTGNTVYHEFVDPPLAACASPADVDAYDLWPDPDAFDYDKAAAQAKALADDGWPVVGPWVSFFEIYCQMRGLEQAFMDVLIAPDILEAAIEHIDHAQYEILKRFLKALGPNLDFVYISDDMAGQQSLFMPIETWDRLFKERLTRWCRLIHEHGVHTFFHSDGAVWPLVPRLIECGVEVLNPIQHLCGDLDLAGFKKAHGDRLMFHGGVDNQHALPFGTKEEVRAETLRCLETLGGDGQGYICCSCHNVQAGTPVENILTMIETAKGFRVG